MKAVVDTNVVVSAGLSSGSAPSRIVQAWVAARFEAITSAQLLDELRDVLARPRIAERLAWSPKERAEFVEGLVAKTSIVIPTVTVTAVDADPADNRVLEAAVTGNADYIVTGDQHLLALGEFEGVQIVTPGRFLAILTARDL